MNESVDVWLRRGFHIAVIIICIFVVLAYFNGWG